MCGLAGIIAHDERLMSDALAAMTQTVRHRGPDDEGCFVAPFGRSTIGFGHRRLSILDLSPLGHQPMIHPHTNDVLIYNGEIYNFQSLRRALESEGVHFRGSSDTEVLLHGLSRHGTDFIDRLHGMFAFAFLNQREHTLLLARDPLGIKPLYTAIAPTALLFASEVRAILASGLIERRLDRQGFASALAYGSVQAPSTIVEHVREFPAGHWQMVPANVLEQGLSVPQRYWDFNSPDKTITEDAAVAQVRRTLDEAVRDHLISDVPVGVFLSSGLDSTIITGLASRHVRELRTFTVGFAEHGDLSECTLARGTAAALGVQHTEINVTGPDALRLAAEWLDQQDQPSLDGLNVYIISKMVREAGITVALSGQGGDEMFGGYSTFNDVLRMHRWARRTRWIPQPVRAALGRLMSVGRAMVMRDKFEDLARCDGDLFTLYLHRRRSLSNRQMRLLGINPLAIGTTEDYLPPELARAVRLDDPDILWTISQMESRLYLAHTLLRDGDTNSMAHSLEIRVPFLDRRVIDLATHLPGPLRFPPHNAGKYLLRKAFAEFLRPELLSQRKRGFEIPVKRWMLGPLRDLAHHALQSLKQSGFVDPAGVDDVWRTFEREPETPIWSRAWLLISLGHYLERQRLFS